MDISLSKGYRGAQSMRGCESKSGNEKARHMDGLFYKKEGGVLLRLVGRMRHILYEPFG
jgi:hypothetical protein